MEKTLTVYRMEDAYGKGPWNGRARMGMPYFMMAGRPAGERFPTAYRSDKHVVNGAHRDTLRSAAPSLQSLRRWFNKDDRARFAALGLSVHAYEVPAEAAAGDAIQISFDVTKAKRIATLDPIKLTPISAA